MLRWLGVEWRDSRDEMPTESSPDGDTERPRDKGITLPAGDRIGNFALNTPDCMPYRRLLDK